MPDRIPHKQLWRKLMPSPGLGGIAATDRVVIVSGRDQNDTLDLWRCLDAATGETLWSLRYSAPGKLDYGASPRATPLIHGDIVYCYGAFGHLHAVNILTGKVIWKYDSVEEFGAPLEELSWGFCGSPLVVGNKLIYYPGGPEAALVALELDTGKVIWKTPGAKPAYGSFIAATFGGIQQVIGHDSATLGGWEVATGKRLWSLTPGRAGDFNVPTPIVFEGRLIVSTENNGTRMYQFNSSGRIDPKPVARNDALNPDTHSPVRIGDRLYGAHGDLFCLDLSDKLRTRWSASESSFGHYTTAVASQERLLLISLDAEAWLLDATADKFILLDHRKLLDDEGDMYAHPAFATGKMIIRASNAVICFDLEP
ncbi:MAG: PQQ-binding-like beta-propeller repeat protein [Gemmataceae bacterium]